MQDDWKKVYTTDQSYKAELVKGMLKEHDIESVIFNKQDRAYVMLGEIEVYVKKDDVMRAINLIEKQNL